MRRRLPFLLMFLFAAPFAEAHGEDILASFYAQMIAIAACIAGLKFLSIARPHRVIGAFACVASAVFAELAVSNIPYDDNRVPIAIILVVAPIIATVTSVVIKGAYAKRKQ